MNTTPKVDWAKLKTVDEADTLLKCIAAEAHELHIQLDQYHECVRLGKLRVAELKYGLKVGSVVSCGGAQYKITDINAMSFEKPWARGNPRKKDGTWGTAVRNLFNDWEVVE